MTQSGQLTFVLPSLVRSGPYKSGRLSRNSPQLRKEQQLLFISRVITVS